MIEVRIGKGGTLRRAEKGEVDIPNVSDSKEERISFDRVREGQKLYKIKSYIVHVYNKQILYYLCPQCRKKTQDDSCSEHGKVAPSKFVVLSCVLDDTTEAIDAVMFNKTVEILFGKSTDEIEKYVRENGLLQLISSAELLGKELYVSGVVKRNAFTGRLELSVNELNEVNTIEEIKTLLSSPAIKQVAQQT